MNYLPADHLQDVSIVDFAAATILRTVNADTICDELKSSAREAGSYRIVLDFQPMIFLNSEMIGGLIKFRKYCVENGIELKVCYLSKKVKSLFALINLNMLFDCYDDFDSAVASFGDTTANLAYDKFYVRP